MTTQNKMKKLVGETFPELKINDFALLGKGKSGIICLVNKEIVFKIPLKSEGEIARWQKNEAAVLRFLEGKLDIEIPKILYTAASENGLYIIGETLLSGIPLTYELSDTFDDESKNDILRQLGRIVRNLHDSGGNDSSWQVDSCPETLEDFMYEFNERFSGETRNVFSGKEINKIEEIAEHYQKISVEHPVKPVLCHYDLHFSNLMFDLETKQITGMLDFGCAGYTEPARDWHYYFYPKYVLEGYGDTGDKYFADRQKFHALSWLLNNLSDELTEKEKPSLGYIKDFILK
jgi:aminoglycoside 2''-phosphotransferase